MLQYLERIEHEPSRQYELPGSETDQLNTPNDWVAIVDHYLSENVRRGMSLPNAEAFEDSLIKAAAVILAALDHMDVMKSKGHFNE